MYKRQPLIRILGANDTLMADCRVYFTILAAGFPAYMLQIMFQSYFVTAGRPHLGLWATVGAGLLNAVLDYLFIVPLGMGVAGAALATVAGYCVPAVIAVSYTHLLTGLGIHWMGLVNTCASYFSEVEIIQRKGKIVKKTRSNSKMVKGRLRSLNLRFTVKGRHLRFGEKWNHS